MFCMPQGTLISPQREPRIRLSRSAPHGAVFCSCGFVFHVKTSPEYYTFLSCHSTRLAFRLRPPSTVEVLLLECPLCMRRRFAADSVFSKATVNIELGESVVPTDISALSFFSPQRHEFFALKILDVVVLVGQHTRGMLLYGSRSFPVPIAALGDSHTVYILNSRAVVFPVDCESPERTWAAKQRFEALRSAALLTWRPKPVAEPSRKRTRVLKSRSCRHTPRAYLEDGTLDTGRIIHRALTALPPGLLRHILEFV